MAGTVVDLSFLDTSGQQIAYTVEQLRAMDVELKRISAQSPALISLAQSFGISYQAAQNLTTQLGVLPQDIGRAVGTLQQLRSVGADSTTQYAILANQLGLSVDQMRLLANEVQNLGGSQSVVQELSQAMTQLFLVDKVNQFKNSVLETGKVFETLNAKLKTTLGTQEAATAAMANLTQFAASTPFQITEVTEAFVKLKQRGINPTNEALRSLGDFSSSQGKSLDQATEALLDASQGQFERLVEFGVKASAAGSKVNLSFQGVNKQVERTPEAISAGVLALGKLDGVAGGMAEKSATLSGAMSNLDDNMEKLAAGAFTQIQKLAVGIIQGFNQLIDTFFSLDPAIQQLVLLTGNLGAAFVTATVSIAAFKAANISAGLSMLISTGAALPMTIQTAALSLATNLATLSSAAFGTAVAGQTTAIGAGLVVTQAATATNMSFAASMGAAALAALPIIVAVAGVVAVAALLNDQMASGSQATREAEATNKQLATSYKSLEAATKKRLDTEKKTAESVVTAAEKERRAKLSLTEAAAEDAAKQDIYAARYEASLEERTSWVDKFMDKIREFINLPAESLSKVFKLTAELPLPGPIKAFFKGVSDQIDEYKLKTSKQIKRNNDIEGFGEKLDSANSASAALKDTKANAKDGKLSNAGRGEVDELAKIYEANIAQIEKIEVANAAQANQKELYIRQLKKEQEEIAQSTKLIDERAKRIVANGTAEVQVKAELAKGLEKVTKEIASNEDADKVVKDTKKALDNGFIDLGTAQKYFDQVAKYTQASADVQIAAANEVKSVNEQLFAQRTDEFELAIANEELKGATEIQTAEATAARVAAIRAEQAKADQERVQRLLDLEIAAGRAGGNVAKKLEAELAKATVASAKANADAKTAADKEAQDKITKELEKAAQKREELESKRSIKAKQGVLKAFKDGSKTIEEAEEQAEEEKAVADQASLAAEIKDKEAAQKKLQDIGSKESKEAAEKLGNEILKLKEKQLDGEIEAVKRANKKILKELKEAADKRKAIAELNDAKRNTASAEQDLEEYRKNDKSRAEIERASAARKVEIDRQRLADNADLLQKEQADLDLQRRKNIISDKEYQQKKLELEAKIVKARGDVALNEIAAIKLAQDQAIAEINEALEEANSKVQDKARDEAIASDSEIAKIKLRNALGIAKAVADVESQAAAAKELQAERAAEVALTVARNGAEALQEMIRRKAIPTSEIAKKEADAAAAIAKASADLEIAQAERVLNTKLRSFDKATKARELVANKAIAAIDKEQQKIASQKELSSAAEGLSSARSAAAKTSSDLAKQELEIKRDLAAASGDEAGAAQISAQIKQLEIAALEAQTAEIAAQFALKRQNLELDIRSKELANEQLLIEKELAALEAKQAVKAAEAEGKSTEEIALLKQKAEFADRGVEVAKQGKDNLEQIAALQRQTLELEAATAQNSNNGAIRRARADVDIDAARQSNSDTGGGGGGKSTTTTNNVGEGVSTVTNSFTSSIQGADTAAKAMQTTFAESGAAVAKFAQNLTLPGQALPNMPNIAGARADGGSVLGGNSYLVGERGPEVVTFGQPGQVTSNSAIMAAVANRLGALGAAASGSVAKTAEPDKLLSEIIALRRQVAESKVAKMDVPVNIYSNNVGDDGAQALALIRASRAKQYGGTF